jgi:hypothetical protein
MKSASVMVLLAVLASCVVAVAEQDAKQPVDYVNPNIGDIGQLHTATIPDLQYPHGMARLKPPAFPEKNYSQL